MLVGIVFLTLLFLPVFIALCLLLVEDRNLPSLSLLALIFSFRILMLVSLLLRRRLLLKSKLSQKRTLKKRRRKRKKKRKRKKRRRKKKRNQNKRFPLFLDSVVITISAILSVQCHRYGDVCFGCNAAKGLHPK